MTLSDLRIAIRYGRGDWPGVDAIPLFNETLYPVAAECIAAKLGTDASPAALLEYPLMYDPPDVQWRAWFGAQGIGYERRPQDRVIDDYDLMLLAVAQGHGITLLRHPFGKRMANQLGLRPVSERAVPSSLKFYIVRKPGQAHAAVERLVGRILETSGSTH